MLVSPIGGEALAVSTAAVGFTDPTTGGVAARGALVTCETAAVRFRVDGTDPTATVGHVLEPGDVLTLHSQGDVAAFKAIRRDGADATLHVTLYADVK